MSFDRELLARRKLQTELTAPDPSDAIRQARMARASAQSCPWAQAFYEQAQHTGLPLASLNDIVAENASLGAAMASVAKRVAAGEGSAALRPAAQADAATRISAAHAKTRQPKRTATRH